MGCMCAECRFAKETGNPYSVLCDNWESDAYGYEMDKSADGCDFGEVDIVAKAIEALEEKDYGQRRSIKSN